MKSEEVIESRGATGLQPVKESDPKHKTRGIGSPNQQSVAGSEQKPSASTSPTSDHIPPQDRNRRNLAKQLEGTKWIDTWNKDFEWNESGNFRTGVGGKNWWKPTYQVLSENKIVINYGPNNICTVVFDKDLRSFTQYDQQGRAITTGRRTN